MRFLSLLLVVVGFSLIVNSCTPASEEVVRDREGRTARKAEADPPQVIICVVEDCKTVPRFPTKDGREIRAFYQGQKVLFCNHKMGPVWITSSNPNLFARQSPIRLQPGERFTTRTRGSLAGGQVSIRVICENFDGYGQPADDDEEAPSFDTDEKPEDPPGGTTPPDIEEEDEG